MATSINIPAIRGIIGNIVYYTSVFTFQQIVERVKKIDDELHTSKSLRDQLQRNLTENYKSIKDYILNHNDRFFNALVLAVYDGEPTWNAIEVDFKDDTYHTMGFLQLNGEEKIFPVDGQHRVEGIKAALKVKPELKDETIAVIFIGHQKSPAGMEKTRRIFTTLNRYAKPVKLGDIIALDEDDIVAITTRELLESYPLFMGNKISNAKNSKAIPDSDANAFTTLMSLYECHLTLYKYFKQKHDNKNKPYSSKEINDSLKLRPNQHTLNAYKSFVTDFWNAFCRSYDGMQEFSNNLNENAAIAYRNKSGGLVYFRPIGIESLAHALLITAQRMPDKPLLEIVAEYANLRYNLADAPWKGVFWSPNNQTMIMGNNPLAVLLLMYMYNPDLLTEKEMERLKKRYADALQLENLEDVDAKLEELRRV